MNVHFFVRQTVDGRKSCTFCLKQSHASRIYLVPGTTGFRMDSFNRFLRVPRHSRNGFGPKSNGIWRNSPERERNLHPRNDVMAEPGRNFEKIPDKASNEVSRLQFVHSSGGTQCTIRHQNVRNFERNFERYFER